MDLGVVKKILIFISLSVLIFSCKVTFTEPLRGQLERSDLDLSKIQYYNSKKINLKREISSNEAKVSSGKVSLENGVMIEEIEIAKNTPGILIKAEDEKLYIRFEEGNEEDNHLVFKKDAYQDYEFSADVWSENSVANTPDGSAVLSSYRGQVKYKGHTYYTNSYLIKPKLKIQKKNTGEKTIKKRKAKGIIVN